ncbi:BAT2-N domain-containing protein [Aphelenchoides bicaudatus]|nr:BAT2-N domain-containing protein [Aphelenchoides bicaudatus]
MSSRGFSGTKARPAVNVTSSYPGRTATPSGGRAATGPLGKNALQTLGKPASVVRRMPPPATLPSLKAEHGQDSGLVAQTGGQGWNKSGESSNDSKSQAAENNPSINSVGAPDLRPTWAKPGVNADIGQAPVLVQPQRKPVAATPNNREFPTLAASLAGTKQSAIAPTQTIEPPKLQKPYENSQGAYTEQEDQIIPTVPPPLTSGSNYIGASVRSDVVNRKLPDRYYGGSQDARATGNRRYDVRQKLAQLSMESKDSPSTPTEKADTPQSDRQSSVPTVPENAPLEPETPTGFGNQQHPSNMPQQVGGPAQMQKDAAHMRGQELRSQDVRQYYPQTGQQVPQALNELPQTASWNRAAERHGYDYPPHHDYGRSEVPSPNALLQPLHGRADSGPRSQQLRGPPRMPAAQHSSQRFDYADDGPPPLMGQRFGSNWEDYNGTQAWNMPMNDDRMPAMARPASNRPPFRGDSRANSESEPGWYANQQPIAHQRRADPNGWNYPLGDYHRAGPNSNRSRTTSNSYAEDYDTTNVYYSADSDRHYKARGAAKTLENQPYEYEYPEDYDRQKYHDYEAHQPAYRMLKRNDEKSAEYFGNHGGEPEVIDEDSIALSQLTRLGRSAKTANFGSLQSESPEIVSSDTFDSSVDQRKTPQQVPAQQKFNRAPGSGKPQQSVLADPETQQQHSAQKTNAPPAENVWKKRMEEQQQKQQDEKASWQNVKQQRKFDYHFPSMSDKKSDTEEPEPVIPQQPARNSHNKPPLQRNSSANQRAPSNWDEQPSSWNNDEYSVDAVLEDDTYEGNRREFFNRQRAQRPQNQQSGPKRSQKTYENKNDSERRQPQHRKRNEPEDAFSNVGEFHAEDYVSNTVSEKGKKNDSSYNGFEGKPQKEDRQSSSRQNPPRKTLNSADERNRQLKPQRAPGNRNTWQRQQPNKIAEEGNGDEDSSKAETETNNQRPQRSSNPRNQRSNHQSTSQQRQQTQQSNRRPTRPAKNTGEQSAGKTIKSPARSENGAEEWETASESSDVHGRKNDNNRKPSTQARPKREKTPKESNGTTKSSTPTNEGGQSQSKNVKPASHTFQNNEESKSKKELSSSSQQQLKLANDSRKYARDRTLLKEHSDTVHHRTVRNGLAGIDMNNISGVIVIDQLPSVGQDSTSDNGDFEEVVSRKTKKQRQIQQQQEEDRINRERIKQEQRQRQREEKHQQRKPTKKNSINGKQSTDADKSVENARFVEQLNGANIKPSSSSLSPLSATDSGVAAISSTSPPQLALDSEHPSLQSHVGVSIPAQHPVWNSPSPQVNSATTLADEPEIQTTPVAPIARPKQRIDNEVKSKLNAQNDLHSKMAVFGSQDPNYSFGYENAINVCEDQTELQMNMDKIKNFWSGDSDALFEPAINSAMQGNALSDIQPTKIGQQSSTENRSPTNDILHEESVRNKSRSSTNHFGSNSQSPLNSAGMLFGGNHNNSAYPIGSNTPFNPISTYSALLSDNIFNGSSFGAAHANSPPVQAPQNQATVSGRTLGSFANPAKVFVANNGTKSYGK